MPLVPDAVTHRLVNAEAICFFLDYDGTLAEFAPTPDTIIPDPELIDLVSRLAQHPRNHVVIVSGRSLNNMLALLPVPGILIAGTYGVEIRLPDGTILHPADFGDIRPVLLQIKQSWEGILSGRQGFYLEDKDWAVAIHARFAGESEADGVLEQARRAALDLLPPGRFRILGGYRFLEVSPVYANKGRTVEEILRRFPVPGAVPVYVGDDDKDEEAFQVVRQMGGVTIVVSPVERPSHAEFRLDSPAAVRAWLENFTHPL
jgi:trehalose 6-phosphate phosphatase